MHHCSRRNGVVNDRLFVNNNRDCDECGHDGYTTILMMHGMHESFRSAQSGWGTTHRVLLVVHSRTTFQFEIEMARSVSKQQPVRRTEYGILVSGDVTLIG